MGGPMEKLETEDGNGKWKWEMENGNGKFVMKWKRTLALCLHVVTCIKLRAYT